MKIKSIRPVLLSAPYAIPGENMEVDMHLASKYRTIGLVEISLEDGTTGIGEGYLAVFAPKVFVEIVTIISPYIIKMDIMDIPALLSKISTVTGYWSLQGAAQHVVSAFDIAFHDCKAKLLNIPVWKLYNKTNERTIQLYGSGGDSSKPEYMQKEFDLLCSLGIKHFKIRARNYQTYKTIFALKKGAEYGIDIAVDMAQNLANPGQTPDDVISFYKSIQEISRSDLFFFEEVLGVNDGHQYPSLREKIPVKFAGGEIVTTTKELNHRIEQGWYDIAQPDATVIGGISAVIDVFHQAQKHHTEIFVHCWGGPVCMAANYHAALAAGGTVAEWPMPEYSIRNKMMLEPWSIRNGILTVSEQPGLGVTLTKEIEQEFKFKEDAIYSCIPLCTPSIPDKRWDMQ